MWDLKIQYLNTPPRGLCFTKYLISTISGLGGVRETSAGQKKNSGHSQTKNLYKIFFSLLTVIAVQSLKLNIWLKNLCHVTWWHEIWHIVSFGG